MPKPIRPKAPPLWVIHSEAQWIARKNGSLTLTISENEVKRHELHGYKCYVEHPKVSFRMPSKCDLPYAEFTLDGRLHKRIDGYWHVENVATGMVRFPGYQATFWKLQAAYPLLDIRVMVLAGEPIPAAVVEHPSMGWHDARVGDNSWPTKLFAPSNRYFARDDGRYVKDTKTNQYVFAPTPTVKKRVLNLGLSRTPSRPVGRVREEETLPLFATGRLRE